MDLQRIKEEESHNLSQISSQVKKEDLNSSIDKSNSYQKLMNPNNPHPDPIVKSKSYRKFSSLSASQA